MARPLAAALAWLSLAAARDARAGDVPAFSALPVGRLSAPPTKRPRRIAPGERAPGIFVVRPKFARPMPRELRHLEVVADARAAEAIGQGSPTRPVGTPSSCLVEMGDFPEGAADALAPGVEWPESLSPDVTAFPARRGGPRAGVFAVHGERVVEGEGGASLEWVDAWVDPATLGARLIARSTLPLKLLRGSAFGVRAYAARDERPGGGRFVQFVVVRPLEAADDAGLGPLAATRLDGSMTNSRCAHVRVGMPVEKGVNDTATVAAPVILPSLDPPGAPRKRLASADPPPPPPPPALPPELQRLLRPADPMPAPPPPPPMPPGVFGGPVVGPPSGPAEERELRVRELNVEVGLSQTSSDKEPLVVANFGWVGREQTRRVAVPIE